MRGSDARTKGRTSSSAWLDQAHWIRRAAGTLLLLITLLPVHRWLGGSGGGVAAAQTNRAAEEAFLAMWPRGASAVVGALLIAWAAGRWRDRAIGGIRRLLLWPRTAAFGVVAGGVALASALVAGLVVFGGRPLFNDSMAQLIQARYMAGGRLAGPVLELPAFWTMQFMINTDAGWVSQYPPGHLVLLALGVAAGRPWLVGPVLAGILALFSYLVARRLFPGRELPARAAALLVALSPFLVGLAGSYMSHVSAAAFALVATYAATRTGTHGSWAWPLLVGLALGAMATVRPYSALLAGAGGVGAVWTYLPDRRPRSIAELGVRLGLVALGALPFAVGLAFYNAHFFGGPWTFGYVAAAGPGHGLGFHVDPWGASYGPRAALAYTSAELRALGLDLLGTPVPVTLLVGLWLAVASRLRPGEAVLTTWAILPVVGNAFYWHHDLVLGPRMLGEAAPAWCMLTVAAAARLGTADQTRPTGRHVGRTTRSMAVAVMLGVLVTGTYFGPRQVARPASRIEEPVRAPPTVGEPSLVFVTDGWLDRLGARLSARGMRQDSIRVILRSVPPCQVESALDGSRTLVTEECARQSAADRLGTLSIAPLVWQGDLPGLEGSGAMWVRNLGPEANVELLRLYPGRRPLALVPPLDASGSWTLRPYAEGMSVFWGSPPQ